MIKDQRKDGWEKENNNSKANAQNRVKKREFLFIVNIDHTLDFGRVAKDKSQRLPVESWGLEVGKRIALISSRHQQYFTHT